MLLVICKYDVCGPYAPLILAPAEDLGVLLGPPNKMYLMAHNFCQPPPPHTFRLFGHSFIPFLFYFYFYNFFGVALRPPAPSHFVIDPFLLLFAWF